MDEKIKILLKKKLKKYQVFHSLTKQASLVKQLHRRFWPKDWKTTYYKEYPRFDKIILSQTLPPKKKLFSVLSERKSTRNFNKEPLSLDQISNLLFYSAGERKKIGDDYTSRYYPSAGARYPLEVYLFSINSDLSKGIYHYNVKSHSLEVLLEKKTPLKALINQKWALASSVLIIITGIFERNTVKYGDRGYRHIMVEAGHMAQNFYLNAAAEEIAISGVGGYIDDGLNQLIDIDGIEESVVYVLATGNF